jgi:hypothetical protein
MLPVRGKSSENVSWCDFIGLRRSCAAGAPEKRGLLRVRFAPVSRPLCKPNRSSLQCQLPTSGEPPLTTPVTITWVSDRVNELKKGDVGLIAPLVG